RIKVLLNKTQKSFPNIQFNIQENIERDVEFSAIHAYHLYRILQEAINNALKHSKCSQIDIEINSTNSWSILIKDNGIGFLKNKEAVGGNGIKNMETRSKEANWKIHWTSDKDGSIVTITPTTN
ncbi:MAG TPA: ATP-binding protein, partial [Chitinophagales bacterium]|nr:ATP-binding protein [Chitinophagales bacterium]